jgi:hypothetical protein
MVGAALRYVPSSDLCGSECGELIQKRRLGIPAEVHPLAITL